ncbi:phage terminase large subunit family protein [Pseudomonas aeruginosa]|nr:phage terminase large subunit family protein [Pseudomonas aeruginosa]
MTAAVDTQHNRLEMLVMGWGEGLERWTVDFR